MPVADCPTVPIPPVGALVVGRANVCRKLWVVSSANPPGVPVVLAFCQIIQPTHFGLILSHHEHDVLASLM